MSTRSSARKQAAGGAAGPASAEKRAKLSNGAAAASASAPAIEPVGKDVKKGSDTDGAAYASVDELWKAHFSDPASAALDAPKIAWYQKGADYWMTQEATVDGVLGGFGHVSPVDVQGSKAFLQKIPGVRFDRAIDCGAGIGRISRALLCPLFKEVDLVEQNPVYVQKAREYCVAPAATHPKAMRHYFVEGLQTFSFASLPEESKAAAAASAAAADAVPNERGPYDVVWIQWVIGHVPDPDFGPFMSRVVAGLRPETGLIVLKENQAKRGFVLDKEDQSITRTDAQFRKLFEQAGLELIATELQKNFPAVLFPVRMYALRPKKKEAAAAAEPAAAAAAAAEAEPMAEQ